MTFQRVTWRKTCIWQPRPWVQLIMCIIIWLKNWASQLVGSVHEYQLYSMMYKNTNKIKLLGCQHWNNKPILRLPHSIYLFYQYFENTQLRDRCLRDRCLKIWCPPWLGICLELHLMPYWCCAASLDAKYEPLINTQNLHDLQNPFTIYIQKL